VAKKWRALRPVFLSFREPFLQAEYNMTRPGGLREALSIIQLWDGKIIQLWDGKIIQLLEREVIYYTDIYIYI